MIHKIYKKVGKRKKMENKILIEEILKLKEEKNAIILAQFCF